MKKRLISDELIGFTAGVFVTAVIAYYLTNATVIEVVRLMVLIFLPNLLMMKVWSK